MVNQSTHNSWYHLKKVLRLFTKVIIVILSLILLIFILVQTPPVQNFARGKIQSYLQNKLKTKILIGKLYIGLPDIISLQNVYIEDQQKDTLVAGGKIKVNIDLFKLFNNTVEINDVQLEQVTAKIKRLLPDTVYNFQFIVNAFMSPSKPVSKNTSVMQMNVRSILLNNVHIIYKDVVTGGDVNLYVKHFNCSIDKFDPYKLIFHLPETDINGVVAKINQTTPLTTPQPISKDIAQAQQVALFDLQFKNVSLSNIDVEYADEASAVYDHIKFGQLKVAANNVDLPGRKIDLNELSIGKMTAVVKMGSSKQTKIIGKELQQKAQSQAQNDWHISVNKLTLDSNNITYDDQTKPNVSPGMDYNHLTITGLNLQVNKIFYNVDSAGVTVVKGSFSEKSGFDLKKLQGQMLYTNTGIVLNNFLLQTPGTELKRYVKVSYPSMEKLSKDLLLMKIDLDIQNSKVQVKDLLDFAPQLRSQPAFANRFSTWYIDGRVTGYLSNLKIDKLQASGLSDTRIDISGTIAGLPDINKTTGDLFIRNITTSQRDIRVFAPANIFPSNITLPEWIALNGTVKGSMRDVVTNISARSALGNVGLKGRIRNATDMKNVAYDVFVSVNNLNVGTIMQQPTTFGTVTADFQANGTGFDMNTANASFSATVQSAMINQYNYHNVQLNGDISNKNLNAKAVIQDPNITMNLNATANLSGKYPAVEFTSMIDSIKTQPLHFSTSPIAFHGKLNGSFTNTDPDNLIGKLFITESILTNNDQRFQLDTIRLLSGTSDSGKYLKFYCDAASIELKGNYKLTEIGSVMLNNVQPYFAMMPSYKAAAISPYDFTIQASILDKPLWRILIPGLKSMDDITINGRFSSTRGWNTVANLPDIVYGINHFINLHVEAGSGNNVVHLKATLDHLKDGGTMNIYATQLDIIAANNKMDIALNIKDRVSKNKYHLAALLQQPTYGDYIFSLKPDNLLLNYDKWAVNNSNAVHFNGNDFNIHDFILSLGQQQLSINSSSAAANAPLDINFKQFKLGTLTGFIHADTLLAEGTLNGNIQLKDITKQLVFTSDLTITDLTIRQDTVGNVAIRVNNTVAGTYAANVAITGRGNDVQLSGKYNVLPGNNSNYDLLLDIRQLQLHSIEGVTMNSISNASGSLNGRIAFNGTLNNPKIQGDLGFNKAAMNITALNSYFTIDQSRLVVDNGGLHFNNFEIKDSAGNPLKIDGIAATNNFSNYNFDISVNADNFRVINSVKKPHVLFYGQLYINTSLHLTGTSAEPVLDGGITVNDKTNFTVVLPQQDPSVENREGVVEFVKMNAAAGDSVFLKPYYEMNKSGIQGFDINTNIAVSKNATISLLIDEGNGDFIRMKGEASLNGGIDKSGKVTLSGSYVINEGAYELSFNFIHRKFIIEPGSRITWLGEPTNADLDVSAYYIANTSPLDLISTQIADATTTIRNTYKQNLPFQVYLKMTGQLLQPDIGFDVVLPQNKNYGVARDIVDNVELRLDQLRQEPSELNKQVFSLLLLNRFVPENPFQSSDGSAFDVGSFARQSVSKILTDQLNRLATDLIQGVDINFDVVSTDDYTTGERRNKTDFNVSLSKRLLSERLTVKVGTGLQLEGPPSTGQRNNNLAGDVALDYRLSRDGRYVVRAYRKNQYEGIVEGYIVETGLSFIITVDYNHIGELLHKKKVKQNGNTTATSQVGKTQ